MKEVIAISLGIRNNGRVRPGVKFMVEDDETADWYQPVAEAVVVPPAKDEPQTLMEHATKPVRRSGRASDTPVI